MRAAIDDVHHRNGQDAGLGAADIAVERQAGRIGRSLGDGERHAEDGVGAESRLVRGAVELDHGLVDGDLLFGIHAADGVEDLVVDRIDGLEHALAEIDRLVAVAQLDRLVRAGGGAGGNGRAAHGAVFEGRRPPRRWGCLGCRGSGGRKRR